ncbi:hypothetical protein DFP72DRAFT_918202 [Ephemerocybe angulata]|uniref:Uncharacterized protein n=1 Tax=Ephemerocybe angulata TaxID=980116 RepID=A0A8H6LZP6_9AGAR|nr:hypothetical protein DFP72DRAFT_918202 [Tulosesus angulatus]
MGFKTFLLMDRSIFGDGAASVGNIEAQVVAGAIAVYHSNNDARTAKGLPVVEAMTVPCISMEATKPTFYLVPVTKNLSNAVATGQYPASQTHVLQCATVAPPDRGQASNWAPARYGRVRDGMANPEYREIALRRFLAFRDVANRCFQEYMD